MPSLADPQKDPQTVTPAGERVGEGIEGVRLRRSATVPDARGSICEIYDPAWGFTEEPVVYVYMTTVRMNVVKGWVVHREQDDRLFPVRGTLLAVLYDARDDSPTRGRLSEHVLGLENRALLRIPHGVFHAVANLGEEEAAFVNLPTRPYRHEDPDKYRLPLDTDEIPYRFPAHFHGG